MAGSSDDEPLVEVEKRRRGEEGKKVVYSLDSDESNEEEKTPSKRKGLTPTKAGSPAKVKPSRKKVKEDSPEDDDDEERFLLMMQKHASPEFKKMLIKSESSPSKKSPAKVVPAVEDKVVSEESGEKTGDLKTGSAKIENSKIRFSKSVPVLVPNIKRVCKNMFVVQCEDQNLDFEGDSGVIGTIKTSEKSMELDLKGQVSA
eukprot:757656-Hanusia_phi.AAC.8